MSIISFISAHGGSGSTTTTLLTAKFLSKTLEKRVLVVDACQQCAATLQLVPAHKLPSFATLHGEVKHICSGYAGPREGRDVCEVSPGLFLLCGSLDTTALSRWLTGASESKAGNGSTVSSSIRRLLKRYIEELKLDYVLVDMGQDTRHALGWSLLIASDAVVIAKMTMDEKDIRPAINPAVEALFEAAQRFRIQTELVYPDEKLAVAPIAAVMDLSKGPNNLGAVISRSLFDAAQTHGLHVPTIRLLSRFEEDVQNAIKDRTPQTRQRILGMTGFDRRTTEMDRVNLLLSGNAAVPYLLAGAKVTRDEVRAVEKLLIQYVESVE